MSEAIKQLERAKEALFKELEEVTSGLLIRIERPAVERLPKRS